MNLQELLAQLSAKKAALDRHRPLSPAIAGKLKEYFDVEWTYHSNAIEGSTITLQETAVILKHGLTVSGKPLVEHLEVINHKQAIDWVEAMASNAEPIAALTIRQIHALVLRAIDDEEAGRYRRQQVRITGSAHVPPGPESVGALMEEFAAWINSSAALVHPVERAAMAHFKLVHIHPFIDGNGRTARLLMNLLLWRDGYPPAIIRMEDRLHYYDALQKAHEGWNDDFILLIAQAVQRSLDLYLTSI